jgi:hypothetical protein
MKHIWTGARVLFQPDPTDLRIRLLQGCLAGLIGLLCLGLSTQRAWTDGNLLLIGGGLYWMLTSLMRFIPRYKAWFNAGRYVAAVGAVVILMGMFYLWQ